MSDICDKLAECLNRDFWLQNDEETAASYLRGELMCDVCAGSGKDMKGEVCGCGGSGDIFGLVDGLRAELFANLEAKAELERMLEEAMSERMDRSKLKVEQAAAAFREAVEISKPAIVKLGMSLVLLGESLILAGSPDPKAPEAVQ